jgi:segregation and condensation protein B
VSDPVPDVPEVPEAPDDAVDLSTFPSGARGAIEAVLMVVEEPVPEITLATSLRLPLQEVADLVRSLAAEYDDQGRGFELRQVAGGWRVFSRAEYAPVVERFVVGGQQARLTQAALETLAVVAYRQPVSRARVGGVRGVNVDGVMRTLLARGLVAERGSDGESGAILYGTTSTFLERMGLSSLDELPALAPYLPEMDALDDISGLELSGSRRPAAAVDAEPTDQHESDPPDAGELDPSTTDDGGQP